jgi:phosphoribosylformylglycinamidine synthase
VEILNYMPVISVEIKFLPGVEDPEALTIHKNLKLLGYSGIKSLKTSKTYTFDIEVGQSDPHAMVKEISEKLLANPVIQSYTIKE